MDSSYIIIMHITSYNNNESNYLKTNLLNKMYSVLFLQNKMVQIRKS